MPAMFYVKRTSKHNAAGVAYSKSLSASQAAKEAAAWEASGETCELIPVTPATKAEMKRWLKVTHTEDARTPVWFQGEEMTFAYYKLNHETA